MILNPGLRISPCFRDYIYIYLLMVDLLIRYSYSEWFHEYIIVYIDDIHLKYFLNIPMDALEAFNDLLIVLFFPINLLVGFYLRNKTTGHTHWPRR